MREITAFIVGFACCLVAILWSLPACTSANSGDRTMQVPATQPDHVAGVSKMVVSQDQANVMTKADVEAYVSTQVDAALVSIRKQSTYTIGGGTAALGMVLLYSWATSYKRQRAKRLRREQRSLRETAE